MGRMNARLVYTGGAQSVAAGGKVAYNAATVAAKCVESSGGGVVRVNKPGTYRVSFNATLVGTAAGDATLALMSSGEAVPGANATATLAVGGSAPVAFDTLVTVRCGAAGTLAVVSSTAVDVSIAALVIERVA